MHAVEAEDKDMVHRLLALGADINTQNRKNLTALHLAAQQGSCKMIGYLIRKDANLESKDRDKETPLAKAVQQGHLDAARMLIERNADITTRNSEDLCLLHHAVRLDHPHRMITLLLDERPELKESLDSYDRTALHHCAQEVRLEAARALLERNDHPDVGAVD
ncbi:ankyrin, partial [Polychaeton citri CBS 116435]